MSPTKIISIGKCCQITWDLQKYGLRDESSVFEWYDSSRFKDVLKIMRMIANREEIPLTEDLPNFPDNLFLANTRIRTSHYTKETLPSILKRRADRFIDCIKSSQPLLFVRDECDGISLEDVEEFKMIVESINPNCNYNLLLVIEPTSFKPIGSPRVFCRSKPTKDEHQGSWLGLIYEACPGDYPLETDIELNDKD
jgi:hypothetical protein